MRTFDPRSFWLAGVVGAVSLLASGPVQAVDGVIEINQAKVKAGGVTPGDTPLFPVTISQSGSYRLTGNLDVADATARPPGMAAQDTNAIEIRAPSVTIDLNGFAIMGPNVCSCCPFSCTRNGSGRGIITSAPASDVAVMNGTVRGMGLDGMLLEGASVIDRVRVLHNAGVGINTGGAVTNCFALRNGVGINGGAVSNSVAQGNGDRGITSPNGSVANSSATDNRGRGIEGTTVTACTALRNDGEGIDAETVTGSTSHFNGRDGIRATTVTGSFAESNSGPEQIKATGIAGQNICGNPGTPCP